ncbi:MAG: beta-1,6-N-acetylglucosaminyltransferase [Microscillaceae bacterium]|nr:beta-1,6-N-acetylglucosaminyltransferase [Microscillaceae bacterium]
MKIAYLILSRDNPEHTQTLIERISGKNKHCFVHIDANTSYDFEELENLSGLTLLKPSLKVNPDGFSQVRAILGLLNLAISQGQFDYFILLSGNDYPVRSQEFIDFYLEKNYKQDEYIHIRKMPYLPAGMSEDQIIHYHFECNRSNPQSFRDFVCLSAEYVLKSFKFRKKIDFQLYTGSPWWALTQPCVRYILEFVSKNPEFLKIYQMADRPCESFFHTIIANSHFSRHVRHSLTYEEGEDFLEAPAVFKEESLDLFFENLYINNHWGRYLPLFVRSFNRYNAYLRETIDEEIADFDHELALYEVYHNEMLHK